MPRKGEHLSEEAKKRLSIAHRGKKLEGAGLIRFLEGKRRYYEKFLEVHGHLPNKGRHPKTEFKRGNTLWVGRHHTEATKEKLSKAFRGKVRFSPELRKRMSDSHIGLVPWNKGLTKETSESVAHVGQKKKAWWTNERKRQFAMWSHAFWVEWWQKHPEAKENFMRIARPTRIELLARESLATRGVPFLTCKRIENLCFPDLILPEQKIAIFCNGCFWHNCPEHNPIVPEWLKNKVKDQQIFDELRKRGWRVVVAWEHEFKENKDVVGQKVDELLAKGLGAG